MALKQNIIYIYFKGKHSVTSKSQYQYNHGQFLYFADLDLPQAFEVHFSNEDKGYSKPKVGSNKLVEIPDEYFWSGASQIYAWVYLHSDTDDGETIYEVKIPLTQRAKPTDEEPLPQQESAMERAIAELNNAVEITTENANKTGADREQVSDIRDEVVDLKEDIDATAEVISQKSQDAINASLRSEASAQNAVDFEDGARIYSENANQSAQEALESKTIARQKAEIATDASAEALGYRDETKGYRDEALTAKNDTQTIKNDAQSLKEQIDSTASDISDTADAVYANATSAYQSMVSADNASLRASQSADSSIQSALNASQSASEAQGYAQTASEKADSITGLTATATTLPDGSSATASYDAETGVMSFGIPKGKDGMNGIDGDDGVSPTVTITPITGGHRITITDADGEHSADVMDGTGSVEDVQINGTSIVEDGVANVPIAGNNAGVIKVAINYGTNINPNGVLYIYESGRSEIKGGTQAYRPITPQHQHEATFYGLAKAAGDTTQSQSSNAVGVYTEDAKSAISEMLGGSVSVSGTTPTIVAKSGIRYVCGEVATLDITLPQSGIVDVVFESGATATILTITGTVKWANGFDPTALDANTTYEINIMDGLGVVMAWT